MNGLGECGQRVRCILCTVQACNEWLLWVWSGSAVYPVYCASLCVIRVSECVGSRWVITLTCVSVIRDCGVSCVLCKPVMNGLGECDQGVRSILCTVYSVICCLPCVFYTVCFVHCVLRTLCPTFIVCCIVCTLCVVVLRALCSASVVWCVGCMLCKLYAM